jgi:creatinine amidohydrolase
MLHLFPELVLADRVDFVPECGREFLDYVTLDQISPSGIWGTPGKASAEKGKAAMQTQVGKIVDFARLVFGDGA